MKIRQGFVSNSSSSSFILLGFRVDESELDKLIEQYDDCDDTLDVCTKLGITYKDNDGVYGFVIGVELSDGEYGFDQQEIDLNKLLNHNKVREVKEMFQSAEDIKLFIGTSYE